MKRKLNGLLSLWLAAIMILSSVAVFAEGETTGSFYVYLGNENIEGVTTLETKKDVEFNKSFDEQNLLGGSNDNLLGWNIWGTVGSGGEFCNVGEMLKQVDKSYQITADEYSSLVSVDGYAPTLDPVYKTDNFTLYAYKGEDEITAGADYDASNYEAVEKYDFFEQLSMQVRGIFGISVMKDLNCKLWKVDDGKYVDYIELSDSDFLTYSEFLEGYIYVEPDTKEKVTISFDANGGEGEMKDVTVAKGSEYEIPECEFEAPDTNKLFGGWEYDGNIYAPNDKITADYDIEFTAIWQKGPEEGQLTISFDANGGSGTMKNVYVDKYDKYELPECKFDAPEDMVFDCWEINGETYEPDDEIEVRKDIEVKALWREEGIVATPEFSPDGGTFRTSALDVKISCDTPRVTIYYTTNGEDPRDSSKRKKYEGNVYIKADTTIKAYAVKDGMEDSEVATAFFDKRATSGGSSSSGSGSSYGGSTSIKTYTIKFNTKGGLTVPDQYISRNKTVKEPEKVTKYGYTFEGWYTDEKYTTKYDFDTPVTKSFTLYAKWSEGESSGNSSGGTLDNRIILTIGQYKMLVFGKEVIMDVVPQIVNDRTMLPARHVAEALGATVEWNESEPKKVRITKDNTEIILWIDSDTAYLNGEAVTLDSPAFLENDRTYTPVRFICENLGATVDWEEGEQKVIILADR